MFGYVSAHKPELRMREFYKYKAYYCGLCRVLKEKYGFQKAYGSYEELVKDEEVELMRKNGVFVAHCPASNMNLTSGIAPIRKYLDLGLNIGLGSDVAGGHSDSIFRAITDAIQVSKMYFRMVNEAYKPLVFSEAFYLATKGGGKFFGNVGSFEEGYEFDAVVMDDNVLPHPQSLNLTERMERTVYLGLDEKNITAKFVAGRKII